MTRAERFGPYLLLELLGEGGMAEVWLARQEMQGVERLLAVKRMHETLTSDEAFVQMFLDELKLAGTLTHPNIGHIFDVGEIEGRYYLAMEYLVGRDLLTVLERLERDGEILPLQILYAVGQGVAAALDHAHTRTLPDGRPRGIVHRDVSPDNVILTFDGQVKLVDFGIALAEGRLARTQAGTLKGKPPYMAPEQILAKTVDARADLFALGSLLYRAATGRHPFPGKTPERVFHKVLDFVPRSAHRVEPSLPVDLGHLIAQAMAKDPADRMQSAEAFLNDLETQSAALSLLLSPKHLAGWMQDRFPDGADKNKPSMATVTDRVPRRARDPEPRPEPAEPATQISAQVPETVDERVSDRPQSAGDDPASQHTVFDTAPHDRPRGPLPRAAPAAPTPPPEDHAHLAACRRPLEAWNLDDHWRHLPERLRAPPVVAAIAAALAVLLFLAAVGLRTLLG